LKTLLEREETNTHTHTQKHRQREVGEEEEEEEEFLGHGWRDSKATGNGITGMWSVCPRRVHPNSASTSRNSNHVEICMEQITSSSTGYGTESPRVCTRCGSKMGRSRT
jgi:hypothetical protein